MRMVSGFELRAWRFAVWGRIIWLGFAHAGGLVCAIRSILAMRKWWTFLREGHSTRKCVKAGGRCYWDLYAPGFPSHSFDRYVIAEMRHAGAVADSSASPDPLQSAVIAITKKCPLKCEHCCEWDVLNLPESMSRDNLADIVARCQRAGVTQIFLSGGEPLQRFNDLLALLHTATSESDFWIITSGVGLTPEGLDALKSAGLTGVLLSVDHWDPALHDAFRGAGNAFEWARRAAVAVVESDLALGLSLCPTGAFTSEENLERYSKLARNFGAGFIQILEPRAVGHYAGRDVGLSEPQVAVLEDFFISANYGRKADSAPIVTYPAFTQRRVGCFGGGRRYLYIDTDGWVHSCPFCRHAIGHALDEDFERVLSSVRQAGCAAVPAPNGARIALKELSVETN